jgi:SAM-dependent methyltransferase
MSVLQTRIDSPVVEAYSALASSYDILTAGYRHDLWLGRIEQIAIGHGLRGDRVLDLACGTGKSFLPLLDRGYEVTACDISPEMVELARAKTDAAEIFVADMRDLHTIGEFDLITCLDDAVNHLLEPEDLTQLFLSVERNLAPSGRMVFDVNTLKTYGEAFTSQWHIHHPGAFIAWDARPDEAARSGRYQADITVFTSTDSGWKRSQSHQQQRHWSRQEISEAAAEAGLQVLAVFGQRRGAVIEPELDESQHDKALYLIAREDTEGW